MPKHLFLCRHAHTRDADIGQTDFDRTLTTKGIEEARRAAQWIKDWAIPVESIHYSAAARTVATAAILAQALTIPALQMFAQPYLYHSAAPDIITFISELNPDVSAIALVGHNPSVSEVVSKLQQGQRHYVPTGGVSYFKWEESDWQAIEWANIKLQINY